MKADSEQRAQKSKQTSGPAPSPVHPATFIRMIDVATSHGQHTNPLLHRIRDQFADTQILEHLKVRDTAQEVALYMVRTNRPARALSILQLAHELGCWLGTSAYEQVAYQLAEVSRWELLVSLVDQCREHVPTCNGRLLNWRLRALIECENFNRLDDVLEVFERGKVKPNRRTYHLMITGHLRNRDVEKARATLEAMTAAGFPVDTSTHTAITAEYRHLGPDADVRAQAMEALESADDRSGTTILNSLLQWSLDARDMPDAMRILCLFDPKSIDFGKSAGIAASTHQQDGKQPTTPSINFPTTRGKGSLEQRTYPVDIATFGILLKHFSRLGNLNRAVQIVKHMNASNVVPNDYIVAELIRAHFIAGEKSTAVLIVAEVCKDSTAPRRLYHEIGMDDLPDAELSFSVAGASPSPHIFNALIQYILPIYGLKGMCVVLRIMGFVGVPVDEYTTLRVVSYLVNEHGLKPRQLPVWISRLQSGDGRPSLRQLNILLASLLRRESRHVWISGWVATRNHARRLRIRLRKKGPGSLKYARKKSLPLNRDPWSDFLRLADKVGSRGIKGDQEHYALRIKFDGVVRGDLQAAKETFQDMLKHGIKPNRNHYVALMESYALAADIETARRIVGMARQGGVALDARMFTILIKAAALQGDVPRATSLFQEMSEVGVRPDIPSVDALASAHFAAGKAGKARTLLLQMWPHFAPFPENLREAPLLGLARAFRGLDPESRKAMLFQRLIHPPKVPRWSLWKLGRTWRSKKGGSRPFRKGTGTSKDGSRSGQSRKLTSRDNKR